MIFNWRVVCSAILFNCMQQTTNFNQRRNGNLGRRICSNKEDVYVYRPNIVKKIWLSCRRYTAHFHPWENQQHVCCYKGNTARHRKTACFAALVLEPNVSRKKKFTVSPWRLSRSYNGFQMIDLWALDDECAETPGLGSHGCTILSEKNLPLCPAN